MVDKNSGYEEDGGGEVDACDEEDGGGDDDACDEEDG